MSMFRLLRTFPAFLSGRASDFLTSEDDGWMYGTACGGVSVAGEKVTPETAMRLSAYFACIRNISEDLAKLPLKEYRELAGGGKEPALNDPVYNLLYTQPNDEMTAITFRQTVTAWALSWGNGYAEIQRNRRGDAVALWPIHPSLVTPKRNARKQIVYEIDLGDGKKQPMAADRMFHLLGMGDGLVGISIACIGAESIGIGLAQQKFGGAFFRNGSHISGVLEHPGNLSKEAAQRLRESWVDQYSGSNNAFKPAVLEEGMKWTGLNIPLRDAQFIESRNFEVTEIARWFRMPPHKIQDLQHATFSNIEHQGLEYVGDTIEPWAVRWEQEAKRKLKPNNKRYFFKHSFQALLRTDAQARGEFYRMMQSHGNMTQNEVRALEDMNPVEGGDGRYIQINMGLVNNDGTLTAVEPSDAANAETTEPDEVAVDKVEPEDSATNDALAHVSERLSPAIFYEANRMVRKEVRAAANAAKKDSEGFHSAASRFYNTHRPQLMAALSPTTRAMCELMNVGYAAIEPILRNEIDKYCVAHHEGLKTAYDNGKVVDLVQEWEDHAAADMVDFICGKVGELADEDGPVEGQFYESGGNIYQIRDGKAVHVPFLSATP